MLKKELRTKRNTRHHFTKFTNKSFDVTLNSKLHIIKLCHLFKFQFDEKSLVNVD